MSTSPASSFAPAPAVLPPLETFCTSGPSPTLHVVGVGSVGRALLRLLAERRARVIAVSDSTATVHAEAGLDLRAVIAHKERGQPLAALPGAAAIPTTVAVDLVESDVVIDVACSRPERAADAIERTRRALRRGAHVLLAEKQALSRAPHELLATAPGRLHCNATLGGTGARLLAERETLRRSCRSIGAVANASTTAILLAVERGEHVDDALVQARATGLLEADATLDLDGTDAASKLAIASAVIRGDRAPALDAIERQPFDGLDLDHVRWNARHGRTTRLVARCAADGRAAVRYESLDRRSPLAVPADRVVYGYELDDGRHRWHLGVGLGALGTAAAVLEDLGVVQAGGAS